MTMYDHRQRLAALKDPEGALRRVLAEVGLRLRKSRGKFAIEDTRGNITPYSLTFDQAAEIRYWRPSQGVRRYPDPVGVAGVVLWPQYECSRSWRHWVPVGHDVDLAVWCRDNDREEFDVVTPARDGLPCQMAGCGKGAAVDVAVHCGRQGSRYIAVCAGHWGGPETAEVIAKRIWRE